MSSVTSPPADQQPAIQFITQAVRWILIGQLWLDAQLLKHGNLYTQCAPYKPEGIQVCPTFNFILIYNLMEFLTFELSTIFTIYTVYINVLSHF